MGSSVQQRKTFLFTEVQRGLMLLEKVPVGTTPDKRTQAIAREAYDTVCLRRAGTVLPQADEDRLLAMLEQLRKALHLF